jgi:hypothetical protein
MIALKQALPLEDALKRLQALSAERPQGAGFEQPARAARAHFPGSSKPQTRQAETPQPSTVPGPAATGPNGSVEDFVEFVRAKKYIQAVAHLQQARLELEGDRLKVAVPQKSFHAGWLREQSAQTRLGELAAEFFGRPVRIEVEETAKKKDPGNDPAARRREAERSALHNPIVQRVVETFEGKVIEVKADR